MFHILDSVNPVFLGGGVGTVGGSQEGHTNLIVSNEALVARDGGWDDLSTFH